MHFERRNAFQNAYNIFFQEILPFKMHIIIFFPEEKIIKKNMCAYPT